MSFSFPLLDAPELVDTLNSWGVECNEKDFKQPKQERWQSLYTALLSCATGSEETEIGNSLLHTQFDTINGFAYPRLYDEAMPIFNLCRAMQRVLYPCGVEDFNISDIVDPKPRRLARICSALKNFINFSSERMNAYDGIKQANDNFRKHREAILEENNELQMKINAIKKKRAEQEPLLKTIQQKKEELADQLEQQRNKGTALQKENANLKLQSADKKSELSRIKELYAASREEGIKLSSQIVQSPERMKGEMDRMMKQLQMLEMQNKETSGRRSDTHVKVKNVEQLNDLMDQALKLIQSVNGHVQKEKEISQAISSMHEQVGMERQMLQRLRQEEQNTKYVIEMKRGKINKMALQHQSKLQELHESMEALQKQKQKLLSAQGEKDIQLQELMESIDVLKELDKENQQEHEKSIATMKNKYQELLEQVDVYHNNLDICWKNAREGNDPN